MTFGSVNGFAHVLFRSEDGTELIARNSQIP